MLMGTLDLLCTIGPSKSPILKHHVCSIFQVIQILSYFLIALYSCYFAWKRLRREGMKPEVRMMFIKKQIAYVIVNLMMWVCFFINAIYRLYLLRFKKPDQKIVKWVE
jgi:hypothetical protein